MKLRGLLFLLAGAFTLCFGPNVKGAEAAKKPAILFCCPGDDRYEYVGFDYMQELVKAGFEVDYIENSKELTWDKVSKFNVLFVYDFPPSGPDAENLSSLFAMDPPWRREYFGILDRFLKAGGGVFLHYYPGYGGEAPNDLLKQWGIQFPVMFIKDQRIEAMSNLGHENICALTDQIQASPVSEGVNRIWYPIDRHYCGAHTMPILVTRDWKVVVNASKTAWCEVPQYDKGGVMPPKDALIPAEPIKDPVLFAIRDFPGGGRLAAIQTWPQFSVGSGMKWLYNNEILSRGLGGKASDYGRLLENTYRWLAEPSLKSGELGGHVTDSNRVREPQLRDGAMRQFADRFYGEEELNYRRPPVEGGIFRGLIGAQTSLSGGSGSVADFAKAAADAKLDYLVFLEDFAKLTPEKLDRLKGDVAKYSTAKLKLFAGYKIKANIGNDLFVFGKNPPWPEDRVLAGRDKKLLNLQYQDENGKWAQGNPALDWCINNAQPKYDSTVGYYDFTKAGQGLRMFDLRVYSMAAIRTYEKGKLVEDMTDDYLTTVQSTAVPTPVSLNIVTSPEELTDAVAKNQALTYAQARSLDLVYDDALHWNCSYSGMNVFLSDGPIVKAWPKNDRTLVFGAEQFVPGLSLSISPIHVTSEAGLKEISIYDGNELFRRFTCGGARDFQTTLYIPSIVYRDMVLIAEDVKGGIATTFAHRGYKEGSLCPVFCSDHVNDGGYMLLAHGSVWPGFFMTPTVPNAGGTWDGGPLAINPLCSNEFAYPGIFTTSKESFDEVPYQIPLLEFADEGATRCRMVSSRLLMDGVPRGNPWAAFGPLVPSTLCDLWASHTYFDQSVTGVMPNAYGAPGVFEGPLASMFTEEFTFKKAVTLDRVRIWHSGWRKNEPGQSVELAIGRGAAIRDVVDLTDLPAQTRSMKLDTGEWFGLFSSHSANSHLFINRGPPAVLEAGPKDTYWLQLFLDIKDKAVKTGDRLGAEIFATTWPMNEPITNARGLADAVVYLENPAGLVLSRGKGGPGAGGLLELSPENGAVELSIPKSESPIVVPVRVSGMNKRWTTGLYQFDGYRTHYYSKGNSGWRALGVDFDGRAYAPLYVSMAPNTHVMIGQPIVADAAGKDLFIQATRLNDGANGKPPLWHVSVNNPSDKPVTCTLKRAMELPGLDFVEETVTLKPGEYRVLSGHGAGEKATASLDRS